MTGDLPQTVTVTIELKVLDETDGHVEGTVSASGGQPVAFAGWLALLELLERSATGLTAGT